MSHGPKNILFIDTILYLYLIFFFGWEKHIFLKETLRYPKYVINQNDELL